MAFLLSRYIPRGSVVLAVTTLTSYVLGLFRDRTFAHVFGVSVNLDAYNAAFLVPDFLFNLLVAGGIAAVVVPLFAEMKKKSVAQAYAYLDTVIAAAMVTTAVTAIVVIIFARAFSHVVAPGISAEGREVTILLMRVLALSPILFALSNALGAMLVAEKRFLFYGLSPVFYNVGIIGGALLLAPRFGILGVAFGTVIGAGLHALVRLIDAWRAGWRFRGRVQFSHSEFQKTLRLMVPKMVGHPVELSTFWIFTSLASLLPVGSIATLNFARNFQSVPVSVLGITMATAVFPALSEAALKSRKELMKIFQRMTLSILVVSVLAAVALFFLSSFLTQALLGGGNFDAAAAGRVALVLGVFCLSVPTESLSHLFVRAFYARQNTIVPVIFSVISFVVAGGSAYLFMQRFGIIGLPLGFFLGSGIKALGLYVWFLQANRR